MASWEEAEDIVHNFVLNWPTRREFNAKIEDFGLAKMLVRQGEPNTMSEVAGTCGYLAPGYAYATKVNEKIDVYGFGVVLPELVTGRERNGEHMCLVEWAWGQFREGKTIEEVVNEEIKEQCNRAQVTTLFNLGSGALRHHHPIGPQ
ncbi:MDIS1-interacting receptor like kinase 1 [Vitis vinifera]|uniref:MDIS1-interacting receptor like kinase 1 n=1 Tax=Vitis vinifera TaxID=29760 RepID=A0A438K8U5_VITVI|nr:MDIS1-interacting receptor like kinase 1 [Vitis vinifera]